MKFGIRSKILAAFGILLAISISGFGILWFAEKKTDEVLVWIDHTHHVLNHSEVLLGHLKDAETGQRGYLLTGQAEYLEPYSAGIENAWVDFDKLSQLTSDNALQQSRLLSIKSLMVEKFAELDETISLTKKGMPEKAVMIVRSNAGKHFMDTIRVHLHAFRAEEERLLELRQGDYQREHDQIAMMYVGEALLMILFIVLVAIMIQRKLVRPIIEITKSTTRLSAHESIDSEMLLSFSGDDEVGRLARSFNEMATTLSSNIGILAMAQEKSEENENRLSSIINTVVDGIITIDDRGAIKAFNPASERLFGFTADEVIGKNVKILMPEPFHGEHDGYLRNYHETSKAKIIGIGREVVGQRKNGSIFPMELAVSEMIISGNKMFTGIVRDITDRKQVEKTKTEFISTVSHELRTPLTSIKGSIGLLKSGAVGELPEKAGELIDIAYNNSDRLVLLINDILDIEKISAGKMEFNMAPVDMVSLVEDAMEANKGYGDEHNVTFSCGEHDGVAMVSGDKDRLMQVLSNLMSNAAKFSPDNEVVNISITPVGGAVRVAVRDEGPGIPVSFQKNIFEKFSQADSSDTRQKGGSGLGLNISRAIVEEHGGTIGFDTEPGKGSTFYFEIAQLA